MRIILLSLFFSLIRPMEPVSDDDVIKPYYLDENKRKLNSLGNTLFEKGAEILKSDKSLGLVILSGGEGTRLGFNHPKGFYKIGDKTLFEWHLDKIKAIYQKYNKKIYLFLMVSESTEKLVENYFQENKIEFIEEVEIFKQSSTNVLSIDKRSNMHLKNELIMAPSGNGDIYKAIQKTNNIGKIDIFNVISVDNVIAEVFDEISLGSMEHYNLEILSKGVIAKRGESVGAFFKNEGKLIIKEYDENLEYTGAIYGNICNHFFTGEFMTRMGEYELPFHEARKKIPFTNEENIDVTPAEPNGIKMEKFIFDSFAFSTKNKVLIVLREFEFSPLKNNEKEITDNPKTCLESLKFLRRINE